MSKLLFLFKHKNRIYLDCWKIEVILKETINCVSKIRLASLVFIKKIKPDYEISLSGSKLNLSYVKTYLFYEFVYLNH